MNQSAPLGAATALPCALRHRLVIAHCVARQAHARHDCQSVDIGGRGNL